jgi:taurine-pyruvate aminotransferase
MTVTETISTSAVRDVDLQHVWHPMLQHRTLEQNELMVLTSGDGIRIQDADGNSYIDGIAGIWNVTLGYGRTEIAEAVYEQMTKLPYASSAMVTAPAANLAARLAEILPGDLRYSFFSSSGSEATETALKIARQYCRQRFPGENRYKVIARYQGYHGFTLGALSATGQVGRRTKFEPLVPGFLHTNPPYCYRCPLHLKYPACDVACVAEIEQAIIREGPETVAAVIAEPIIGGGGVLVPPDEYLPQLRAICDRYDVLLILDEVINGFGRTGRLFACEHWGVVPDMITLAKGATSGYLPLGACVVTGEVFEAFLGSPEADLEFSQISTYGGHPVCCTAALTAIDILMRERLWENAETVGNYLMERLSMIDSPFLGDVRGKGLMIAIELVDEEGGMLDAARTAQVQKKMKAEGLLLGRMSHVMAGPESIFFVAPPLILTMAEADEIAAIIATGLASIS